jgi:putative membrane protein
MLAGLILRFLCGVAGLWVAAHVVHGIGYDSFRSLLAAALILGLINAVVRPILIILTLPLTLITLGLFLLVINAGMLGLTTVFIHGFHVHGFWAALWGSVIVSIAGWVASALIKE